MDNRRTLILMLLLLPLLLFWNQITTTIFRQLGYEIPRPAVVDSTTAPSTQPTTSEALSSTAPATASTPLGTAPSITAAAGLRAAPTTQSDIRRIGSSEPDDATYRMGLQIRPTGAALDWVILNEFKQTVNSPTRYTFQQPYSGVEEATRALATRVITVNGTPVDLSSVAWEQEKADPFSVTYGVTLLADNGTPLLRVHKSYQVLPKTDPTSQGYEVLVSHTFQNLTDTPIKASTTFNGPTMPPQEIERGGDRQTLMGHVNKGIISVTHDVIENFTAKAPTRDYTKDKEGNPLVWVGTSSIYFNAIVHPLPAGDRNAPANFIEKVTAANIKPDAPEHNILLTFVTTEVSVGPGASVDLPMRVFFGPRQRKLLNNDYYSSPPLAYDQTLVLTSGPCGICTFQWLINWLVVLLGFFHAMTRDWGLAIILLVILVRALLHPITKRSQISMANMSKMGPEMERLKVKYKDQPDELNKAMMQFYKQQGITPILGCLPMFLQMPIWLALWQSLQTTFELRQAPFLRFFGIPFSWIHDLSKPDNLIPLAQPVEFFFLHISGLNILPLLLAVVFFIQQKMQPKPATETPEQAQQRKMMQWMSLLFPVMLYSGPSGLNLYILTSTAIGIVESKIVRDHIKQRDEAEKAGRVIIDPGTKHRGGGGSMPQKKTDEKPKGLMRWLADLQERAEQIRKDSDKKK